MDLLTLSRLQFAATTVYHFFFVPLTIGLGLLVALMETAYVRSGNEEYKRMTKFWGKLFAINFAMGVVTGIVQEFQFGMNWAEYARFMGDIFGAPLAIEALLAFFLESTFLGVWIFGWDRLPKAVHALSIWLVAIGSILSAFWILVANSFMQEPVGYAIRNGRAEMTDFGALLGNPHVWVQFPHVLASGAVTAAFFVLGISAWHLLRKREGWEMFHRSFKWAAVYAIVGSLLVILVGHAQAQHMVRAQPMKMAAAEALWNSEDPASMSLFSIGQLDDENRWQDVFSIRVPGLLSFMSYNQFTGEVQGLNDLQADYELAYGPGNYMPPVAINYWSFRAMVGAGFLMIALAAYAMYLVFRDRCAEKRWFHRILPFAIVLPYLANTTGWLLTELGRQPWIVFGEMRVEDAVSRNLPASTVLFSLVAFVLIYGVLMAADIYLLRKFARNPQEVDLIDAEAPADLQQAFSGE